MSLQNLTTKADGTIAVSGGTDVVYAPDGMFVSNGISLTVPAVAEFRKRPRVTAKSSMPVYDQAKQTFSRQKTSVSLTLPSGTPSCDGMEGCGTIFNNLRIELTVDPSLSAENIAWLLEQGAQMLFSSGMTDFWLRGSLK